MIELSKGIILNSIVYTPKGSRIATEEDDKEFREALQRGEVKTLYEVMEPLNKWKREQMSTPVKRKKYQRDMRKFITGKETIVPNIVGIRLIMHKHKATWKRIKS